MKSQDYLKNDLVLLWSGGLDSTGMIVVLLKKYDCRLFPIFVRHGQRNEIYEEKAVLHYSKILKQDFPDKLNEPFITSSDIPAKEFKKIDFDKRHFLRNSDLINNAVRYAIYKDIHTILIATNEDDFLDGQPLYFEKKSEEIAAGSEYKVKILSPFFFEDFLCHSKHSLIEFCNGKYGLSETRSCYENQENPCQKCEACKKRVDAFSKSVG